MPMASEFWDSNDCCLDTGLCRVAQGSVLKVQNLSLRLRLLRRIYYVWSHATRTTTLKEEGWHSFQRASNSRKDRSVSSFPRQACTMVVSCITRCFHMLGNSLLGPVCHRVRKALSTATSKSSNELKVLGWVALFLGGAPSPGTFPRLV